MNLTWTSCTLSSVNLHSMFEVLKAARLHTKGHQYLLLIITCSAKMSPVCASHIILQEQGLSPIHLRYALHNMYLFGPLYASDNSSLTHLSLLTILHVALCSDNLSSCFILSFFCLFFEVPWACFPLFDGSCVIVKAKLRYYIDQFLSLSK